MIYLERVAKEIKEVGLYDLILQDIQKLLKKESPSKDEILEVLKTHPEILESYKQTNVEYNLSNIHIKDIDLSNLKKDECKKLAKKVNQNLSFLKKIEKYTLDFEQSPTLVIIFSIEFFVLFSVQYFIVLLNLKEWQWWIYALFALSIFLAWKYAKLEKKKYKRYSKIFQKKYSQTKKLLEKLEEKKCIKKENLIIKVSQEHI